MYSLTLTKIDRRAFDFVYGRYSSGDIRDILLTECEYPEDLEWNGGDDITFKIPEHIAWEINYKAMEDTVGGHSIWPCFSDQLTSKLNKLLDQVI